MDKKILIVGAGFGQVPAIKAAKEIGLTTVVVDKNPNAIGANLADFFHEVDVLDQEGVLRVARDYQVSGAMTMQSDLPVPTIGYVNDALGLKGVSLNVARSCSNKMETRKVLKKKSSAQPRFEIVSTVKEAMDAAVLIGFPCVIKAPDSSGSRGVTKVNTENEVKAAFDEAYKYTREKSILVEEFIVGLEFGAQTFSVSGDCKVVLLHGDTMSNPPYMIPIGHSFPFTLLDEKAREIAKADIKDAVNALGITDGPANVDLILDAKSKRVKIIEIGARIGATCLPELVYHHTGIDWVKSTLLNAIDEEVDLQVKTERPVAALIVESPRDGLFDGFEITDSGLQKGIKEFEITVKKGDHVHVLRKGTDRIGKILAFGKDASDAEVIVRSFRDHINIKVKEWMSPL